MKHFVSFAVTLILLWTVGGQECGNDNQRIDCHPDEAVSEEKCLSRGCLWCPTENANIPWCHLPRNWGYVMVDNEVTPEGVRVHLAKVGNGSYFGGDAKNLTINFEFEADYRLRIKITDDSDRFEVPLKINPPTPPANFAYSLIFTNSPVFSFKVIRRATGTEIFDSSLGGGGGLTFSDQFIQLGFKIPTINAYGFGENEQHTFKHDFSRYQTMPLWARDQAPEGNNNMYGVQPYYTVVESDGNVHSVMIVNSNAQEVVVTPYPGYVYRTIGGLLDLYIFLGPTPDNTQQQFTEAIGRQDIPPYWGLGFQLSRWGYDNLANMKAAVERTASYQIPHDVQYGDIDIMERELVFTYNKDTFAGLPEYIAELKAKGIKFIPILDPCISYQEQAGSYPPHQLGNQLDVWVKRQDGTPAIGSVWPGLVYFPDFSKNSTSTWWKRLIVDYKDVIDFDGLWIDMNEPANFGKGDIGVGCSENRWNYPPYVPRIVNRELFDMTLCPDHVQEFGIHYNTHSLYGWSQSKPTLEGMREALNGKRGVVISRSTFLGSGNWAAHWLGDNFSNWPNLHYSIIGMLSFNMFGMPYVGADICGFKDDSNEELCTRWQQLGAFYPYARNHNHAGRVDQDPGVWGAASANSTRKALEIRYTLLPYLYTLFYLHKLDGASVVRPFWYEFPTDPIALGIDTQFLWGSGVAISPVLDPATVFISAYFPAARWFSYHDGSEVPASGNHTTLLAAFDFINVHVRGGVIIPTQEPGINTQVARQNPFGLIVPLDENLSASGVLYYDDGDSVDPQVTKRYFAASYSYATGILTNSILNDGYPEIPTKTLASLRLLGSAPINEILVNGQLHANFTTMPSGEVRVLGLNIPMVSEFTISFA